MDLDELFHQLNELEEKDHSLIVKGLALNGFITLERISKLIPYGEIEKIDEEVNKYFKIIEDSLKEVNSNGTNT